jgi:hypothetical protein
MWTRLLFVAITALVTYLMVRLDEKIFDEDYEWSTRLKVSLWGGAIAAVLLLAIPPALFNTNLVGGSPDAYQSVTGSAIGPYVAGPPNF